MSVEQYAPPPGWRVLVASEHQIQRADRGEFLDRRAAREDAKISRCTCGTWTYDDQGCGTCGLGTDLGTCGTDSPVVAA